ncbi:hypothetical protein ACFWZT_16860 [Streptomyces alboflavus]|uniref:hypothetical protein n=1 Tax=Streptomyces alboflavus TaxID=67267 RepID=UPI0036AFA59D
MSQMAALQDEENRRAQSCMHRFGYRVDLTPHNSAASPMLYQGMNENTYGLTSISRARRYGYHLTKAEEDDDKIKDPPLTTRQKYALNGGATFTEDGKKLPAGGCRAEAERSLQKGAPSIDDEDYAAAVALDVGKEVENDSRVRSAFRSWSTCMRQEGFHYSHPMAPGESDRFLRTTEPGRQEIRTAVADVECKRQTNVIGIWISVETVYQKIAIRVGGKKLHQVRRSLLVKLRNAGLQPDLGATVRARRM